MKPGERIKYEIRKDDLDSMWKSLGEARKHIKHRDNKLASHHISKVTNILMNLKKIRTV